MKQLDVSFFCKKEVVLIKKISRLEQLTKMKSWNLVVSQIADFLLFIEANVRASEWTLSVSLFI